MVFIFKNERIDKDQLHIDHHYHVYIIHLNLKFQNSVLKDTMPQFWHMDKQEVVKPLPWEDVTKHHSMKTKQKWELFHE